MKRNEVVPVQLGKKPVVADTTRKNFRDPKNWPKTLQDFITRSFTKSNELNFNKELKDQFQLQLKKIIDKAIAENKVELNDWNNQKLPIFDYSFKKLELMCDVNAANMSRPEKRSGILSPQPHQSSLPAKRISMKIPKPHSGILRPNNNAFIQQQQPTVVHPPSPVSMTNKRNPDTNFASKALKRQRLERFLKESLLVITSSPPPTTSNSDSGSTMPLIGTCRNLEKNYLRLTSAPVPELVRPLPVLKKTLRLLRSKYEKEKDYNYLKNQLKSLRQDLTVQHIKNKFTIKAYEFHSKIAIEFKDLGEFNQCQSQLKQLYQLQFNGNAKHRNKFEFLGYRILYFIITRDFTEIMSLKLSLLDQEPELMGDEFILLALKLWDYSLTNNYHDFFQLYQNLIEIDKLAPDKGEVNDEDDEVSMNNLNHTKFYYFLKMMKDFIVDRQLLTTFSILSKSYKKLGTQFLITELFCNDESQFVDFLESKKLIIYVEGGFFEFAKAKTDIHNLIRGSQKVDIKGQI